MAENQQTELASGLSRRTTLIICAVLVLAGIVALSIIFSTEPRAQRETAVRQSAMTVDVITPASGSFRPVVEVLGTVKPARDIELRPQVDGRVIELSEDLVPGGFVRRGEVLLRIEDSDYRNSLLQRQSELQQAIAELEIEQGRQAQARREYRELQKTLEPENEALVLRRPQLRSAQAAVQAAEAAEAQARLDLERTVIRAPFDAQVLERTVNLGSRVDSGDSLAHLVGLEQYWVEATVPPDQLRWLSFPGEAPGSGSPVSIRHRSAWPEGEQRQGRLYRLVGELEGGTRLARVLVEVDDPLALEPGSEGLPSLIIGAFVETHIEGREISDALVLPRETIRQDDTVWLMRDDELHIQQVEIVFQDARHAYISGGLAPDDRVVTTNLATVKQGIRLRPRGADGGGT
jgi:RND family efflux transporter MFP subunit